MPSIGETLREFRNKKGISEETVAKVLRIKVQRVLDLEADRYDQFPAPIYARSFLRQYVNYLGIDSATILQRFTDEHPMPDPKSVFEIAEDQCKASSTIRRNMPVQLPGFLLTSTGKAVLIAILIFLIIAVVVTYWASINQPPPIKTGTSILETTEVQVEAIPTIDSTTWEKPALPEAIPAMSLSLTNNLPLESGFNP